MPIVDGATRLYGIIGDPIVQVRSPEVLTARFRAAGRNAILVPLHIRPDCFDQSIAGIMTVANLDGIVVTVPYKARILPFVHRVLPTAQQVGAVNAMRREADGNWTGDMFDGRGLVRGLRGEGVEVSGCRAMLMGAGGAGSAVAFALAEAGAAALTLWDIDGRKAGDLAVRISHAFPACSVQVAAPATEAVDMIINATPVGMAPNDGMPSELGTIDKRILVIDVIMKPAMTPLLLHARECGCRTIGGRVMLEGQSDEVMRFFGVGA
jgi:shikimate dehydrogenase